MRVIIKFCKAAVFFSYPSNRMNTDPFCMAFGGHEDIVLFTDYMIIAVFNGNHHRTFTRDAKLYRNKGICSVLAQAGLNGVFKQVAKNHTEITLREKQRLRKLDVNPQVNGVLACESGVMLGDGINGSVAAQRQHPVRFYRLQAGAEAGVYLLEGAVFRIALEHEQGMLQVMAGLLILLDIIFQTVILLLLHTGLIIRYFQLVLELSSALVFLNQP